MGIVGHAARVVCAIKAARLFTLRVCGTSVVKGVRMQTHRLQGALKPLS